MIRDINGNILHGRNLDFDFARYLSKLSANAEFYKNGKLLFKAEILVGFVSIITGVKNNKFSANINTRESNHSTPLSNIYHIVMQNTISPPWLLRKTFESANSFEEAV